MQARLLAEKDVITICGRRFRFEYACGSDDNMHTVAMPAFARPGAASPTTARRPQGSVPRPSSVRWSRWMRSSRRGLRGPRRPRSRPHPPRTPRLASAPSATPQRSAGSPSPAPHRLVSEWEYSACVCAVFVRAVGALPLELVVSFNASGPGRALRPTGGCVQSWVAHHGVRGGAPEENFAYTTFLGLKTRAQRT